MNKKDLKYNVEALDILGFDEDAIIKELTQGFNRTTYTNNCTSDINQEDIKNAITLLTGEILEKKKTDWKIIPYWVFQLKFDDRRFLLSCGA